MVFFAMLILSFLLAAALFLLSPSREKSIRVFLALSALAVVTRFFVIPSLLIEYDAEDYETYISAVGSPLTDDLPSRKLKNKPFFLFKSFFALSGERIENLFAFSRFFSVLLVLLTYLAGLELLRSKWGAALAAAGVLLCPGQLLCGAAINRHLPAVAFLLLSIFLLLSGQKRQGGARLAALAASFFCLSMATLQKLDFFYFPFLYFLVAVLYTGTDENLSIRKLVNVILPGALALLLLFAVDNIFDLMWFSPAAGVVKKFVHPYDTPTARYFINLIPANLMGLALFTPPALPAKVLCLLAILSPRAPRFRWVAGASIVIFYLVYLPSSPWLINTQTARMLTIAPFIYLAAGETLGGMLDRANKRTAIVWIALCAAACILYYPYIAATNSISPKMAEYRMLKKNADRIRGCEVLYTSFPEHADPFYTLTALSHEENFIPVEFSSVIREDSIVREKLSRLDSCNDRSAREAIRGVFSDPSALSFIRKMAKGSYLYLTYAPDSFETFQLDDCVDNSPAESGAQPFNKSFLNGLREGKCALFLKDSDSRFGSRFIYRMDQKNQYALSLLETREIARTRYSALYEVKSVKSK